MKQVKITAPDHLSTNDKGSTYKLATRPAEGFILAYRNKGSVSGNHWHEGKSPGKNPEILLLLSGEIELYAKDLQTGEELREHVSAPVSIEIEPNVLHTLTAITDCSFLEFNSLEEHKADTYYPDAN